MKIEIAVYTAQEGYSWQPGCFFSSQELRDFKGCIGRFPSPDSEDFPFGGVFLFKDRVVFYRYHVAKKIDFRGRDALYCVLGAVPKAMAARVSPESLFALPEFSAPMQPFPVSAELAEAGVADVPEWLRNLDVMTLDVRISGSAGEVKYDVRQERVAVPEPATPSCAAPETRQLPKSQGVSGHKAEQTDGNGPQTEKPHLDAEGRSCDGAVNQTERVSSKPSVEKRKTLALPILLLSLMAAVLVLAAAAAFLVFRGNGKPGETLPAGGNVQTNSASAVAGPTVPPEKSKETAIIVRQAVDAGKAAGKGKRKESEKAGTNSVQTVSVRSVKPTSPVKPVKPQNGKPRRK